MGNMGQMVHGANGPDLRFYMCYATLYVLTLEFNI